ncbi:uncharacterized protein SPPG_05759 [Spizellomyces punctatus DAOM BR117]|uniref:RING-type domain-containing protein n=1 Tax=Spizellomyces punctatus (strain DAOM BR117) TaxID=645134 RepID=A0A0L0HB18_SPIPD|nr:uncharacterized protein SPPG_05759 [Spizellomyces punctatus DAOM BR117]KNC98780.1 hypothetical protein SPPG_05759 [Spizellomyces punctatus DAOM BR117]|eukprot:XP_016606820.1 hypothetical protein SPPG_05759 [Spizellomyces punctatus DAOM BR117]
MSVDSAYESQRTSRGASILDEDSLSDDGLPKARTSGKRSDHYHLLETESERRAASDPETAGIPSRRGPAASCRSAATVRPMSSDAGPSHTPEQRRTAHLSGNESDDLQSPGFYLGNRSKGHSTSGSHRLGQSNFRDPALQFFLEGPSVWEPSSIEHSRAASASSGHSMDHGAILKDDRAPVSSTTSRHEKRAGLSQRCNGGAVTSARYPGSSSRSLSTAIESSNTSDIRSTDSDDSNRSPGRKRKRKPDAGSSSSLTPDPSRTAINTTRLNDVIDLTSPGTSAIGSSSTVPTTSSSTFRINGSSSGAGSRTQRARALWGELEEPDHANASSSRTIQSSRRTQPEARGALSALGSFGTRPSSVHITASSSTNDDEPGSIPLPLSANRQTAASNSRLPQTLGGRVLSEAPRRAVAAHSRGSTPTEPRRPSSPRTMSDEDLARMLQEEEYGALQPPNFNASMEQLRAIGVQADNLARGSIRRRQARPRWRENMRNADVDMDLLMAYELAEQLGADMIPNLMDGLASNPENYLPDEELDTSYEALLALSERIGAAKPKGLSRHLVESLPRKKYKPGSMSAEEAKCTVCLSEYDAGDSLKGTPCAHWFHDECIDRWLKDHSTCPICRTEIDS